MSQAPSMPLFIDAYIADTTHLSTEEHGAYLLLLMAMWRRNGAVPDDDRDLARMVGLSVGRWKKVKDRLLPFLSVEDGEITQKRLKSEWEFVQKSRKKQSERATKRWQAERSKNNDLDDAAASARHVPKANNGTCPHPHPQPQLFSSPSESIAAPPEKGAKGKGTRIPPDWQPSQEDRLWAKSKGMADDFVNAQAEAMRLWAEANANRAVARKLDWSKTFRGWLLREHRPGAQGQGPPGVRANGAGFIVRHGSENYSAWRAWAVRNNDPLVYKLKDEPGHEAHVPTRWPPR